MTKTIDINVFAGVRHNYHMSMLPYAKEILDVGSGASGFANFYPYIDSNVTFIDKEKSEENGFLKHRRPGARFRYIETYSDNLSMLKNDSFDMVIFNHVIEHLTDKQVKGTMEEIYRVLKVGGFLMIGTPNKTVRKIVGKHLANEHHIREYTNGEMIDIHNHYGFEIIKNIGILRITKEAICIYDKPKKPEEGYLLWFLSKKRG